MLVITSPPQQSSLLVSWILCNDAFHVGINAQRLSGSGYCFSAALPPFLASAGIAAVEILENNPQLLSRLHKNISLVHSSMCICGFILKQSCYLCFLLKMVEL